MADDAPWLKYQAAAGSSATAPAADGPWTKYQTSPAAPAAPAAPAGPDLPKWAGGQGDDYKPSPPTAPDGADHSWLTNETLGVGAAAGESFGQTVLGGQEAIGRMLKVSGFGSAGDWLIQNAQTGSQKIESEAEPYRKAAPAGALVGDMVGMAPVEMATRGMPGGPVTRAAASGAIAGGLQPTKPGSDFLTEKAKGVTEGAAGGAVAGAGGKLLSGAIAPTLNKDAAALVARGVQLTPGQMAGGVAKRAEDALSSVPIVGSFIGAAQRKSIESFNRSVIDDALSPIGARLPKNVEMGHDAVAKAHDLVSDAYDQVLPKLVFRRDAQFDSEMGNLRSLATNMPPDQAKQFDSLIQNNLFSRLGTAGAMLGDNLKIVESDLGKFASDYKSSSVASERQLGDAVREAQRIVRTTLERQNPADAPRLQAINAAFARLVRVEGAAGNRPVSGGLFTPADLLGAIKRGDTSSRKAATATGRALGQDFATSAQNVLPSATANSGTPERAMWAGVVGGSYFENPKIALGLGAATAPYTGPALAGINKLAQPAGPVRQGAADTAAQISALLAPVFGKDTPSILSSLGITPATGQSK